MTEARTWLEIDFMMWQEFRMLRLDLGRQPEFFEGEK